MKKSDLRKGIEDLFTSTRDSILVREVLQGHKSEAFASIMTLYHKRIYSLGMSFLHNEADVEDFVQEVFIKVYTNLSSFRGESKFSTWLTRIAYTTAVNTKSRTKIYESLSDDSLIVAQNSTPEEELMQRATKEAIKEAVRDLPDKYKFCVDLYFFYDMSYEEIGVITGLPVNTLKSHIFRAKKILKDKLKDFNI